MRSSLSIGVTACELSFRAQCIKGNYCGANKGNLTISRWHTQSSVFSVAISEEYFGAKRILISRSPLHESSTPLPAKTIAVHEKYMEVLAIAHHTRNCVVQTSSSTYEPYYEPYLYEYIRVRLHVEKQKIEKLPKFTKITYL